MLRQVQLVDVEAWDLLGRSALAMTQETGQPKLLATARRSARKIGKVRLEYASGLSGLLKACERRPVSMVQLEAIADKVELLAQESPVREVSTGSVGETIMAELKDLDKVAYVRFASVYLDFKDVQEFMAELKDLLKSRE